MLSRINSSLPFLSPRDLVQGVRERIGLSFYYKNHEEYRQSTTFACYDSQLPEVALKSLLATNSERSFNRSLLPHSYVRVSSNIAGTLDSSRASHSIDSTESICLSKMQSLLSQATYLSKTVDEAGRKKLIDSLRDIAITLEDEQESAQRLLYSQYPLMALRLGCDIGLFNILQEAAGPMESSEIAEKTGVAPKLMGRLLRYMSSCRLIQETDKDTFTANNVTKTFCNPGFQGGVYHYFDYIGPGIKHLPDFLKKRGYTDVESVTDCPVPAAWGSDLPLFLHYQTVPELFEHFNNFMTVQRLGMPTWLTVYPYNEMASITNPERPLFVDVGGGFGHQSIALREALPNAPNKIILQDIPATLEKAIKHPGVEIMVQDFWKPQIIKNAKIYYMRNIIHDYPDEKAIKILRNTRDAMSADSVLLIDEMYLGTKDIHWQATQLDITMMTALSSIERTEEQWRELIPKAGLKINKVYQYTQVLRDSIIECVRA